jgi:hypothetical protein
MGYSPENLCRLHEQIVVEEAAEYEDALSCLPVRLADPDVAGNLSS